MPPLALPDPSHEASAGQLAQYEAIALFVERAQAVRSGFALSNENASAVAEICRRLDGLPLAIELAAARVRTLAPFQIAARLDECFRLLGGGGPSAPAHQQTLRAAMEWSHAQLTDGEQLLLGRLAVFAGGWTLAAAEEVCADPERSIDARDVLDLMTGLVEKSLVEVDEGEEPRYRLLEIVRQYARERLDSAGDSAATEGRHLRWCVALCERTRPQDADPARVALVAAELANVRAALRWAIASGEIEQGFRFVNSLTGFWYARAQYAEGRAWVDALVAHPGGAGRTKARADALRTAGHLAFRQCDFAAARAYQDEAAAISAELGDEGGVAAVAQMRAYVAATLGDLAEARRLYEAVVASEERLGRPTWLLFGLIGLADTLELAGQSEEAARLADRALGLARELGSQQGIARALRSLGRAMRHRGASGPAAREMLEQALAIKRALHDRHGAAEVLVDLADLDAAAGDGAGARSSYEEGLRIAEEAGSWREVASCLEGLAALVARDEPGRAAVLGGAAAGMRQRAGGPLSAGATARRERWVAEARGRLGSEAFDAAEAQGRCRAPDRLVELAV